ncbi:DUF2470 domain-containing protein [Nocardioides caldifontis]|uniref:DUF2470 domain-containing protein n=1 Tax=Nocardioides caldifontis TaxID=2588938 RepID=UPI0011DF83EC|nr:DUF2470 domain-containing protein [Nocardioides caldifontis]
MTGREEHVPSLAEEARTALAAATAATLRTRGCPHARTMTVVPIAAEPDGSPVLWLEEESPVARLLEGGRVVSVQVGGPEPFRVLELTGPLEQLASERPGHRQYRMRLLAVRLAGPTVRPVAVTEFAAAEPDPLRACAAATLRHLELAHAGELLACVRAHGQADVLAVVPRRLDRYGITLAALCLDGVRSLRLHFPHGPVDSVEQIGVGLRAALTCRCRPDTHA